MTARRRRSAVPAAAAAVLASACGEPGAWDQRGPDARYTMQLFWGMTAIAVAVSIFVFVLLYLASRRKATRGPNPRRNQWLVLGAGVVMTTVILLGVSVWTLVVAGAVSDRREVPDPVTIEVVGHQFWWEVRYPGTGVVTANEIRVPVDRYVELTMATADVIHSVWIPQLTGKIDMIPGQTTRLVFLAEEPGEYRGWCAEFCGLQHARMLFHVFAHPAEEFDEWLAAQARPAAEPVTEEQRRGQEVFLAAGCGACHSVRGTDAQGLVGPDLTHLASRPYIGAGILANERGQLAGWVANPQALKPGNLMPPSALPSEDLLAVVSYLESLE